MKTAPITVTEIAVIGAVLVGGFVAYRAFSALKAPSVETVAAAVDVRQTAPNSALGQSQNWVDAVVRKGQDAGASTFVTSFFTGLFK